MTWWHNGLGTGCDKAVTDLVFGWSRFN